jgi:NAD(P)-dependent dehydrogenase (short-subunit alcohol dehydrogenase family)
MGFHVDGFAREIVNMPARLVVPIPDGVSWTDAACAPIAFGTVQHMLFDNARLQSGETILVHAGGSGIGTAAIRMAKAIGATVITTVGDDEKGEKARALGADHVINYREDRFEHLTRKITGKKGVDVVFEHVGPDTWNGSLLCLKRGGRLVTCGSTSGVTAQINLYQLFQQQLRIFGSFGCRMENIAQSLAKMAGGIRPSSTPNSTWQRLHAGARAAGKPQGLRQDRRPHLIGVTGRNIRPDRPGAAGYAASRRSTWVTRSRRWKGFDSTLAFFGACESGLSATAAKPVMNITFSSGSSSVARRASSIPSISGMTISVSRRVKDSSHSRL